MNSDLDFETGVYVDYSQQLDDFKGHLLMETLETPVEATPQPTSTQTWVVRGYHKVEKKRGRPYKLSALEKQQIQSGLETSQGSNQSSLQKAAEVFFSDTFGLSGQALAPHLERHSPQRVLSIFLPSLYWRTQVGADNKI